MPLIIVESPTKSKTIGKLLGPEYNVLSSYGHIRDLPKSKLGVDIEHNFEPKYIIPTKARKTINLLKKEVEKTEITILATDEDREGEAIAWHLSQALNLNGKNPYQRIVFHEITKSAIENALRNPRKINMTLVNAKRNPLPPFTTSTLQQESWQRFRFPAKFTMRIAQQLYEKGHISYHRTDSLNLSDSSLFAAKKFITKIYGQEYWAGFLRKYKAKGRVQEAHEAIRPTYPNKEPERLKIKAKLDNNQFQLYDLIWRRFIASQMAQAIFDSTTIDIEAKNYLFRTSGQTLKFDGFLKVYPLKFKEVELPLLEKNEILKLIELKPSQHFTQPPARFTEATLIKELEKNGIGRPSTYAPTLTTIQGRNYINKNEEKRFQPTEIGIMVNDLLVEHFSEIVDIKFTARMEENLDKIAQGEEKWVKVLENFYNPFEKNLLLKEKKVSKKDLTEKTERKCPKCKASLVIRMGRFGKFYGCSKFPECKHTEPFPPSKLGIKCPKCKKGEIVERRTKKGKIFYGCSRFPKCDFALWDKPTGEFCPECNSSLVETKKGQIKCSNKECDYIEK